MGVARGKAAYWEQKGLDHTFHPEQHGGVRYHTLPHADRIQLYWACYLMWNEEPALTDEQVVNELRLQGHTWLVPGIRGAGAKRTNLILKIGIVPGGCGAGAPQGSE
eukprot:g12750.t1